MTWKPFQNVKKLKEKIKDAPLKTNILYHGVEMFFWENDLLEIHTTTDSRNPKNYAIDMDGTIHQIPNVAGIKNEYTGKITFETPFEELGIITEPSGTMFITTIHGEKHFGTYKMATLRD